MNLAALLDMVTKATNIAASVSALSAVLHELLKKEDPNHPALTDLQRIAGLSAAGKALETESDMWLNAHPKG